MECHKLGCRVYRDTDAMRLANSMLFLLFENCYKLLLCCLFLLSLPGFDAIGVDTQLKLGPYYFNPSIVQYGDLHLAAVRTAYMKFVKGMPWWFSKSLICRGSDKNFTYAACDRFDPWHGAFSECRWQNSLVEGRGIEDAKLFVWPGKGVYSIFGTKPWSLDGSKYCKQPVIFQQYFYQIWPRQSQSNGLSPTALSVGKYASEMYDGRRSIKEKNWMPFIYKGELHVVYSMLPHVVFKVALNGTATERYTTNTTALLQQQNLSQEQLHGGPPLVYVETEMHGSNSSGYYLGIFHFFTSDADRARHYHHHAFKMQGGPPFHVLEVSHEIPLVFKKGIPSAILGDWRHQRIWKDTSYTAYINGLFVDPQNLVHISYGSGDIDSRKLTMNLTQLNSLFS